MNTWMAGVCVLAMAVVGVGQTQPATTQGTKITHAERIVQIPALPLGRVFEVFEGQAQDMSARAWIGQAARAVFGERAPGFTAEPESPFVGVGESAPVWKLTLDAPEKAKETMDAIVAELGRVWEGKRQELVQIAKKARQERKDLERKIDEQTAGIRDVTDRRAAMAPTYRDPQVGRPALVKANEELETLETDLAGMKARREAIARKLDELSVLVREKVLEDAVSKELKVVVDARTQAMERAKDLNGKGVASTSDVEAAVAAVAEAKARLLERQEQVAGREGGETLAAWNRELATLSIDTAEKTARMEHLKKRAAAMGEALEAAEQLPKLEEQLKDLQSKLADARERQTALEAAAAMAEKARVEVTSEENR